jgi:hypothetical protein
MTIGYRPVYGETVTEAYDHLLVGGCSFSGPATADALLSVGNSDLNDVDNFWSTDVNEADYTVLPATLSVGNSTGTRVLFFSVENGVIYAYTSAEVFYTTYLGLPLVFSWSSLSAWGLRDESIPIGEDGSFSGFSLVRAPDYLYVWTGIRLLRGRGGRFEDVAPSVRDILFYSGNTNSTFRTTGAYNTRSAEVVFYAFAKIPGLGERHCLIVLQEKYGTWYTRVTPRQMTSVVAFGGALYQDGIVVGSGNTLYIEDPTYIRTPITENDASFVEPFAVSNVIASGMRNVIEASSAYLTASLGPTAGSNYNNTTSRQVVLSWASADNGAIPTVFSVEGSWSTASRDGLLTLPRRAARGHLFKLSFPVVGGKPPGPIFVDSLTAHMLIPAGQER